MGRLNGESEGVCGKVCMVRGEGRGGRARNLSCIEEKREGDKEGEVVIGKEKESEREVLLAPVSLSGIVYGLLVIILLSETGGAEFRLRG